MKKIIVTLSILMFGITQADFTIKVPLENKVKYYNWLETAPIISEWINNSGIYDCSNWSPETSTINIGQSFTQTATDCNQDQIRTVQDKEIDEISGAIRDNGEPYIESRTITINDTREAIGTKETWVAITPTYTEWVDSGSVYGCSNWSPDPSTVNSGLSFTQTATDCSQDQTRLRQDREQETTTNEIRNNGSQVTENMTIASSSTRTATGTKVTKVCSSASGYSVEQANANYYSWYWANSLVGTTNKSTTLVKNGYTYTIGTYLYDYEDHSESGNGYYRYYQICRQ